MNENLLSKTSTKYGSYHDYIEAQVKIGLSYESDNALWRAGQRKYITETFSDVPKDSKIADIACGDGVGLCIFKEMDFPNVQGFELCRDKIEKAKVYGYTVTETDVHDLSFIPNGFYDIIYSSHTLEHLLDPISVLKEFKRISSNTGKVFIVLPYGGETLLQEKHWVHCGIENLGLNVDDKGETLENLIKTTGFIVKNKRFDNYREDEIWLELKKPNMIGDLSNEII